MNLVRTIVLSFSLCVFHFGFPAHAFGQDTIPPVARDTLSKGELEAIVQLELDRRDLSITDAARGELISVLETAQALPTTPERVEAEAALFKNLDLVANRRNVSVVNSVILQAAIGFTCRPPNVWPKCQG